MDSHVVRHIHVVRMRLEGHDGAVDDRPLPLALRRRLQEFRGRLDDGAGDGTGILPSLPLARAAGHLDVLEPIRYPPCLRNRLLLGGPGPIVTLGTDNLFPQVSSHKGKLGDCGFLGGPRGVDGTLLLCQLFGYLCFDDLKLALVVLL